MVIKVASDVFVTCCFVSFVELTVHNNFQWGLLWALSESQNWPAGPLAWPVILTMKNAFFQEFFLKHHFLRARHLGFDWIVLIKSKIIILTGIFSGRSVLTSGKCPIEETGDTCVSSVNFETPRFAYWEESLVWTCWYLSFVFVPQSNLWVFCYHFICFMSLFEDDAVCRNLTLTKAHYSSSSNIVSCK